MAPVAPAMDRPAGRPVADQVKLTLGCVSVAVLVCGVIAVPDASDRAPGLATVTALVTVQMKLVEPWAPEPSEAVRVTPNTPAAVGLPVMTPVAPAMDKPAGRPVADQVMVAAFEESFA